MVEHFTLDGMHCVYLNGLKRFMKFLQGIKSTRPTKKLTERVPGEPTEEEMVQVDPDAETQWPTTEVDEEVEEVEEEVEADQEDEPENQENEAPPKKKKKRKTVKKKKKPPKSISATVFANLGKKFAALTYPREFTRKPRGFDHYAKWKATELRMFLLYGGDILVRHEATILNANVGTAFQAFCMATRIMSDELLYKACCSF